ncbi:MAG TPA: serine/threonine-protein kinase [Fimbriiglobus sp.]|nr:serine/threonine-protein kinase [Fimbriiglobus sp.]
MASVPELADVLIDCRVVSPEQWEQAARIGGDDLGLVLDAIGAGPPGWWDDKPPTPPGLTDYQRGSIEHRFETDELHRLRRDLALNQFLLLEKLGQGGQGEVYRGRQFNPPRVVAVKTLIRDTEVRRRRFEREARTMMRVLHPAVARFHLYERVRDAAGHPTDEYLIAMEFVAGTPLHRLVRRTGPVPWPFAAHWAVELLGGLEVIHRAGLIHRDVKPENVMALGPAPGPTARPEATAVKLLDFGAVKRADETGEGAITRGRVFIGTAEYAPPEQWTGHAVAASDLYALGGALFFTLTGRTPFQLERRDVAAYRESHLHEEPPDVREFAPDVPPGLSRLVARMLAKAAADRGTADELIAAFRQLAPEKPSKPAPRRPRPVVSAQLSAPTREPEGGGAVGSSLSLLERVFLPRNHRPSRGQEPPAGERLLVVLRRPAVLLLLAVLVIAAVVLLVN